MAQTLKEINLDAARTTFAAITGTPVSDWGMLPDASHKAGGGYHCGCRDIIDIGKWATAGSAKADYSVRQERDRVGGNVCMAIDGPPFKTGGQAAWIRHNNMLQQALAAGDPELGALRAINYTPDGKVKRRYDTNNRGQGVIPSTDTVLWHTHYEFWRNQAGTELLRRTLNRMAQIMRLAILGQPLPGPTPPPNPGGNDEMAGFARGPNGQLYYVNGVTSRPIPDGSIADIVYTASQGFSPMPTKRPAKFDPTEWESEWVRLGWGENWGGTVAAGPVDAAKLTAALTAALNVEIGEEVIVAALESSRGQAALTDAAEAGANKAEDA